LQNCFVCGSNDTSLCLKGTDLEYGTHSEIFKYYRCLECYHIFQHPLPSHSTVENMYDENYYTVNKLSPLYLKGFINDYKIKKDVTNIITHIKNNKNVRILDLGCGDASRLFLLREKLGENAELFGLDITFQSSIIKQAQNQNINLIRSNIESDNINFKPFDLIVMTQIIEHFIKPNEVIKKINKLLKKNGSIVIETPSPTGLDYFFFKNFNWGGYHIPRHIHLFSRKSIRLLLLKEGLIIKKYRSLPSPGFWIISFRNKFFLNSIDRSNSFFEFLNFSNFFLVSFFTAFDIFISLIGFKTSNQRYIVKK
jgi:2-polyprenyl-3-methyl-5-hydroxy-6-metoxy-1,4-benzoquinol methylase